MLFYLADSPSRHLLVSLELQRPCHPGTSNVDVGYPTPTAIGLELIQMTTACNLASIRKGKIN